MSTEFNINFYCWSKLLDDNNNNTLHKVYQFTLQYKHNKDHTAETEFSLRATSYGKKIPKQKRPNRKIRLNPQNIIRTIIETRIKPKDI